MIMDALRARVFRFLTHEASNGRPERWRRQGGFRRSDHPANPRHLSMRTLTSPGMTYRDDLPALEADAEALRNELAAVTDTIARLEPERTARRRAVPQGPPFWVSCIVCYGCFMG